MMAVYVAIVVLLGLELYFIEARKGPKELKIVASVIAVICILAVVTTEVLVR